MSEHEGLQALADFVRVTKWLDEQGLEIRKKHTPSVSDVNLLIRVTEVSDLLDGVVVETSASLDRLDSAKDLLGEISDLLTGGTVEETT